MDLKPSIHQQLATAAKRGNLAVVRRLLRKGARPDVWPSTAVAEAIYAGHFGALTCLLEAKPAQDVLDFALHAAVGQVNVDMVRLLLESGARVTFKLDDPELFKWPIFFGDTERPEVVRRMLVAHMTATKLESAMGGGEPQVRTSSGGMEPL